jgi:hypothetical protein
MRVKPVEQEEEAEQNKQNRPPTLLNEKGNVAKL